MGKTTAVEDEDEEEEEEKEEEDEEEKVANPRGNGSRERNWGYNFIRFSLHFRTLMLSIALSCSQTLSCSPVLSHDRGLESNVQRKRFHTKFDLLHLNRFEKKKVK